MKPLASVTAVVAAAELICCRCAACTIDSAMSYWLPCCSTYPREEEKGAGAPPAFHGGSGSYAAAYADGYASEAGVRRPGASTGESGSYVPGVAVLLTHSACSWSGSWCWANLTSSGG